MKPDERSLLLAVYGGLLPRVAGRNLGMPQKRVDYLCEKWSGKGWYDFGVTVDMGWLTAAGVNKAKSL